MMYRKAWQVLVFVQALKTAADDNEKKSTGVNSQQRSLCILYQKVQTLQYQRETRTVREVTTYQADGDGWEKELPYKVSFTQA